MDIFLDKWLYAYWQIGKRYFFMATVMFILFYVIFKAPMMGRRIQQKFPKNGDYYRDIFFSIISIGIFALVSVFTLYILRPYTNVYKNISDYSTVYYAFTFVWMFFVHDAYFYWAHRVMHHPKIFKWVHLTHHKSTNPSPWTAYAFHPLEAVMEAAIITIFAFLIPVHQSAIMFYMIFQIAYNVYGHLGYEIMPANLNKHWLGKWFNTSVAHNMHHKYSVKNYGLWTTIWDRMCGTMHPKYDEVYETTTQRGLEIDNNSSSMIPKF